MTYIRYSNILKLKSISIDLEDIDVMSSKDICESYMKDCQKKSLFKQDYNRESMIKTTKFLQQIHTNLRESLLMTYHDHVYYILFTDNWSDITKIYTIKFKSDAYNMFKSFQTKIERQSEYKIIKIRHDNEEEYLLTDYLIYLKELDIVTKFMTLYTSQQNDKSERLNYLLISMIRLVLYNK